MKKLIKATKGIVVAIAILLALYSGFLYLTGQQTEVNGVMVRTK